MLFKKIGAEAVIKKIKRVRMEQEKKGEMAVVKLGNIEQKMVMSL